MEGTRLHNLFILSHLRTTGRVQGFPISWFPRRPIRVGTQYRIANPRNMGSMYRQTLVNRHCTVKSHVAGRGLLLSPPPTLAQSVLVVPDHLVKELLGTLGLALGRHRRHFDGASCAASTFAAARRRLLLRGRSHRRR